MRCFAVAFVVGLSVCMTVIPVSGKVVFEPHVLPCQYTITAKSYDTIVETGETTGQTSGMIARQGRNFRQQTSYLSNDGKEQHQKDLLVRADLKKQESEIEYIEVFEAEMKNGENSCKGSWVTADQANALVDEAVTIFTNEMNFDKKEKGKFETKECDVYSLEDGDHKLKYYVTASQYIFAIEETNLFGSDHIRSVTTLEYKFSFGWREIYRYFVISEETSPKCSSDAYNPPSKDMCSNPFVFQPHSLPCSYEISVNEIVYDLQTSKKVREGSLLWKIHGDFFKETKTINIPGLGDIREEVVVRTDLKKDGEMVYYKQYGTDTNLLCYEQWVREDEYNDSLTEILGPFKYDQSFDSKVSGEFQGKKCDIYVKGGRYSSVKYFVDKNNYLIGSEEIFYEFDSSDSYYSVLPRDTSLLNWLSSLFSSLGNIIRPFFDVDYYSSNSNPPEPPYFSSSYHDSSSSTIQQNVKYVSSYEYKSYSLLKSFVVDKDFSAKCSEDAYNRPTKDVCPEPPVHSSSDSAASSAKSSVPIAFLGVVVALLSLF